MAIGRSFFHAIHRINETTYEVVITPGLLDRDKVLVAAPREGVSFWIENPEKAHMDARELRNVRFQQSTLTDVSEIVRLLVGILGCSGRIYTDEKGDYLNCWGRVVS